MAEGAGADEDRQAVISSALLLGCGWGDLRCAHRNAGSLGSKME